MGLQERLFALEGRAVRIACAWMCRWRQIARWVAAAISPQWPVTLARQGVEHTWLSYLGGMNGIIRNPTWRTALEDLVDKHVEVVLVQGAVDRVPVAGRARSNSPQRCQEKRSSRIPKVRATLPIATPVGARSC